MTLVITMSRVWLTAASCARWASDGRTALVAFVCECECSDVAAQVLHLARDAVYVVSDGCDHDAAGDKVMYVGQLLGVAALALTRRRSGLEKGRAVCRLLWCVSERWWMVVVLPGRAVV
jgi:hypothetical protein